MEIFWNSDPACFFAKQDNWTLDINFSQGLLFISQQLEKQFGNVG